MKVALFVVAVLSAASVHSEPTAWQRYQTTNTHRIYGRFVQVDYGFSIRAPHDEGGYVTNGGDANHGMTVILGDHRSIVIYPEYTDPEWGNDRPCRSDFLVGEYGASRSTTGRVRLGRRQACQVAYEKGNTTWRVVQARRDGGASDIMYTLILRTNRRSLGQDLAVFRRMMASFRQVRITS